MKKTMCLILALMLVLCIFAGCGKTKLLKCDGCGKDVEVKESSEMTDEWIIYCKDCNEEFFGDDPLLGSK